MNKETSVNEEKSKDFLDPQLESLTVKTTILFLLAKIAIERLGLYILPQCIFLANILRLFSVLQ